MFNYRRATVAALWGICFVNLGVMCVLTVVAALALASYYLLPIVALLLIVGVPSLIPKRFFFRFGLVAYFLLTSAILYVAAFIMVLALLSSCSICSGNFWNAQFTLWVVLLLSTVQTTFYRVITILTHASLPFIFSAFIPRLRHRHRVVTRNDGVRTLVPKTRVFKPVAGHIISNNTPCVIQCGDQFAVGQPCSPAFDDAELQPDSVAVVFCKRSRDGRLLAKDRRKIPCRQRDLYQPSSVPALSPCRLEGWESSQIESKFSAGVSPRRARRSAVSSPG
ncbi:hypothetical protein J8273_7710 [Carpediemonas membranifera]|uniref:Uncharacterized protein n=1 Tax=Carpediemonas membranifera TaxID=201153 RepID=A0A8J6APS3_9EUKA|nr:hypothetical protein J8273_7710 [Carpediemonas membranifera]|eukprot:KAG9390361.1 hypothetical protein J8273_7710 [Carpediemonas membranifera]